MRYLVKLMSVFLYKVGGEFFVLPSSVHEVLLVPDNGNLEWRELEELVQTVNETTVDAKDKLSDHVYHYDTRDKVFELASAHESRMAEKTLEQMSRQTHEQNARPARSGPEKKSVREELMANKAVCKPEPVKQNRQRAQRAIGER